MHFVHRLTVAAAAIATSACGPTPRPITENQQPLVLLELPDEVVAGVAARFSGVGTRDVDGDIVSLRFEAGDGSADEGVALDATSFAHTFTSPGLYTVALVAIDDGGLEGRARKPLTVLPPLDDPPPDDPPPDDPPPDEPPPDDPPVDPLGDDDGDGMPNADDAAPTTYNGLLLEAFAIGDIPRDLLARQKAEDVVAGLEDAEPLSTLDAPSGWLGQPASSAALSSLFAGAPDRSELFALRFSGTLTPPVGAASLVVEVGADDLCVVFVDGAPVASADEEYALDFLRSERAPAQSAPISLFGPVELQIVVANDGGPYAWDVALRFVDDSGAVLAGAPTQGSFLLP